MTVAAISTTIGESTQRGFDRELLPVVTFEAPLGPRCVDNSSGIRGGFSMSRKSTGKRLRFEVFKRDGFACRYCGAQPPAVVLVVDHIIPVVDGGETVSENLNTACETCNQGKADKRLAEVQPRPDADLLYLEAAQEAAELGRYRQALARKEMAIQAVVGDLQDLWIMQSGLDWVPADHLLRQMISRYSPELVEAAIRSVAPKVGDGNVKRDGWWRYVWVVLRNMADEQDAANVDLERAEILNWVYAQWFNDDLFVEAVRFVRETSPIVDGESLNEWQWSTAIAGMRRLSRLVSRAGDRALEEWESQMGEGVGDPK